MKEADKITRTLLEKRLIFCAKRFPVSSSYFWKGKRNSSKEVLLIMDSLRDNFEKVRKEVAKIHSYKTFVLLSSPVIQTTVEVENWIKQELRS